MKWAARKILRGITGFRGFWPDMSEDQRAAVIAEAEAKRDGILKGLAFIEARARNPRIIQFYRDQTREELERLERICRSAS